MIILTVIKTFDYFLDLSKNCVVQKGVPKAQHDFLFSPQRKYIQFTVIEEERNQNLRKPWGAGLLMKVLMCETEWYRMFHPSKNVFTLLDTWKKNFHM